MGTGFVGCSTGCTRKEFCSEPLDDLVRLHVVLTPDTMNSPYKEGQRAAERGESPEDNPYEDEHLGAQWEEGYYAVSEPKQKTRRGKPEWN